MTTQASEAELQGVEALRTLMTGHALYEAESSFLSDTTLLRYYRARDSHLDKAAKMLGASLCWRQEWQPEVSCKQTTIACSIYQASIAFA